MKKAIILLALTLTFGVQLQAQKLLTKNGFISFYSHTPMEDIEASNNQVTSILDTESGGMAFAVLMKSFQFEKALMQEHFNEKYVESDKFPKAQFKGSITNLDEVDFSTDGEYPAKVEGQMSIHGKTHPVNADGLIIIKDGQVTAKATFPLTVADYDIKIPGVVEDKIAKAVDVKVEMKYDPFEG